MKAKSLHIILMLIIFSVSVFGEDPDSTQVPINSPFTVVVFEGEIQYNSKPLQKGDVIGISRTRIDTGLGNEGNSNIYTPEEVFVIQIDNLVDSTETDKGGDLVFSFTSKETGCVTKNVKVEFDTAGRKGDTLRIIRFEAFPHTAYFEQSVICKSENLIPLVTDLSLYDFKLNEATGLRWDSSYSILPKQSDKGFYAIHIQTSNYCLDRDTLFVEVQELASYPLQDTINICVGDYMLGAEFDEQYYLAVSDSIDFPSPGSSDEIVSGSYMVVPKEGYCGSNTEVYFQAKDTPNFEYRQEQLCDKVAIYLENTSNTKLEYDWGSGLAESYLETDISGPVIVKARNSAGCLTEKIIEVENKPFRVEDVPIIKEEANCWTDGKIFIGDIDAPNARGTLSYRLNNRLTDDALDDLEDVVEGVYRLTVIDKRLDRECEVSYEDEIKIVQKCLEDYPVFSPNQDGLEDEYFIPHEGSVKIYDRNSNLLIELETPAYWNGRDQSGSLLPMGNYMILTDTGRPVNITIVR